MKNLSLCLIKTAHTKQNSFKKIQKSSIMQSILSIFFSLDLIKYASPVASELFYSI